MSVDAAIVRRIAHLARIAVTDDEVPHLQGELNAMLAFVEQLSEVNVEGVEPMTSVTPMEMKKRIDIVNDGEIADDIVANADKISGVVGENLCKALDWLPQAKTLITVRTDCDLAKHMVSIPESLQAQQPDQAALIELYRQYGFKTWLREATNGNDVNAGTPSPSKTTKPAAAQVHHDAPQGP